MLIFPEIASRYNIIVTVNNSNKGKGDKAMNKEVMSERMRGLREDHDYTQKYVAYKLGIDQRAYSTYETGKREMPVHKLYMLCELYGMSMDYMVGRSGKKNLEC